MKNFIPIKIAATKNEGDNKWKKNKKSLASCHDEGNSQLRDLRHVILKLWVSLPLLTKQRKYLTHRVVAKIVKIAFEM